jgi:hypothetical protein
MTKPLNKLQQYIAKCQAELPDDPSYDNARLVCLRWLDIKIPPTAYAKIQFDAALFAVLPQIKEG